MRALAALIATLLSLASLASPWDADSIASILGGRQLDPVEGLWQFPDDGARLLICRSGSTAYDIYLLESPRLDVAPGTCIGRAVATAQQATYEAHLDNKRLADKHIKKSNAVLRVTPEGTLSITPYSTGKRLSLWRWIPYFLRVTVRDAATRPKGIDGAIRIDTHKPCL